MLALPLGAFVIPLYLAQLPAAAGHLTGSAVDMEAFGCVGERALASSLLDGLIPQPWELADQWMWRWHLDVCGARRQEHILQGESPLYAFDLLGEERSSGQAWA